MRTMLNNKLVAMLLMAGVIMTAPSLASAAQSESPVACNEAGEPNPLVYGDHTTGCEIKFPTDLDSFIFDGTSGDVIRILLRTTGVLGGRLELRGPGDALIVDTFCSAFGAGCSVIVDETLAESGVFSIAISDNGSDQTGGYTLQLEKIPPVAAAQPVAYNEAPIDDTIAPTTDLDFFAFNGAAGTDIRVTVRTTGTLGGRLEIRDPSGAVMVDTFCSAFGAGCTVTTDQSLTVDGTYLVAVSDNGIDQTGDYQINIQCLFGDCPPPPTRPECDIQMSQAIYLDGETATADVLRVANPGPDALALELKIWLDLPGASLPVLNVGAGGGFVLPAGSDTVLGPVPLLPITPALPRGTYEFSCRMLDPVTGRLLREDRNFFDVQ